MYLATFMHAVHCRNANCNYATCLQFKRVVAHSKQCQKYKNSQCDFCRQLLALCINHAKSCKDDQCQIPFCASIKIKLKQQKAFNNTPENHGSTNATAAAVSAARATLSSDGGLSSPYETND